MGPAINWTCILVGARGIARDPRPSDHDAARRTAGALRLAAQRITRRPSRPAGRAAAREVGVVGAALAAGSEKAAAHRLGLSHSTAIHHLANARTKVGSATTAQLVWILASRLSEPEGAEAADE